MDESFKHLLAEGGKSHGQQLGNEIVNLSCHHLSQSEESLLYKGLRFVPAPHKSTLSPYLEAASQIGTRLKNTHFFRSRRNSNKQPFTAKSDWCAPDTHVPPEINETIESIFEEISKLRIHHNRPNLTLTEKKCD